MPSKPLTSLILAGTFAGAVLAGAVERTAPLFRPDDPVLVDDDAVMDAGAVTRDNPGTYADFVTNTFRSPGDRTPRRAVNVNTLDELPDSSWFSNRIGSRALSLEALVRGPDSSERLDVRRWLIVEGKDSGRQPGFRAIDSSDPSRQIYQIEFDSPAHPEMATGAEIIGTAIYHALGYNVVETYLIDLDPSSVSIDPEATIETAGRRRPFTRTDLDQVLRRAARRPDGRYRASASRFAEGRNVGPFRYYGTRADDPNDIYPHEHRRELRGNRVFAAWLNHDDSRGGNTLDMLIERNGRRHVRHYMLDFGSILGSGTGDMDHAWVGHEYVVEPKPGLLTLATFGLWRRPYILATAPAHLPAAGNFTADGFEPARWKPHYPNAAFRNMQPDDAFWAARRVAAFSSEAIAAIVRKAQFTDPAVTDYVTGTLERRRDKVLREWLTAVNPIVSPAVSAQHILTFTNAAEAAALTDVESEYVISWFTFDNEAGVRTGTGEIARASEPATPIPAALEGAVYAGVEIRTRHSDFPAWNSPVRIYLRADGGAWRPVGIERELADRDRHEKRTP